MPLITAAAARQEDKVFFLMMLRSVGQGWTRETTAAYFQALSEVKRLRGGRQYPQYLKMIEEDALARLSAGERLAVARKLAAAAPAPPSAALAKRPFVREWTGAELLKKIGQVDHSRNFSRGEAMFVAACSQCHQVGSTGTLIGPDLTSVSRRFPRQDILRAVIEPSAVIDEKYRVTTILTSDGRSVSGTILNETDREITLAPDPTTPETQSVAKSDVDERGLSPVSPMPTGLLNTLSEEEILDLLAYLEAGGDPTYRSFQRKEVAPR
jgi:putative heme-binding domain-containing protein